MPYLTDTNIPRVGSVWMNTHSGNHVVIRGVGTLRTDYTMRARGVRYISLRDQCARSPEETYQGRNDFTATHVYVRG